jgi:uncharacterized phiE125 gp8 family phage protein
VSAAVVSLAEVKAYLRIEHGDEDALLAGLVRTAASLCEAFTGQVLLVDTRSAQVAIDGEWHRLGPTPARRVTGAWRVAEDGPETAIAFDSQIDCGGDAWVRIAGEPGRARVAVEAGMAADWNGLPEPLRQGIVRLAAYLHAHRDAADDAGPPAAVAALWRPWRRMRLS